MDLSLSKRAARAFVAGCLLLAWSPAPAFAHSFSALGPRAAMAHWGGSHGQRAFNGRGQVDRRDGFSRRWGRGRHVWDRSRWARYGWGRNGWRGRNGPAWNNGFGYDDGYGAAYWDGDGEPAAAAGGAQPLVFAPSVTVYAPVASRRGDAAEVGGCVIHKLEFDGQGNNVGEKQYPQC